MGGIEECFWIQLPCVWFPALFIIFLRKTFWWCQGWLTAAYKEDLVDPTHHVARKNCISTFKIFLAYCKNAEFNCISFEMSESKKYQWEKKTGNEILTLKIYSNRLAWNVKKGAKVDSTFIASLPPSSSSVLLPLPLPLPLWLPLDPLPLTRGARSQKSQKPQQNPEKSWSLKSWRRRRSSVIAAAKKFPGWKGRKEGGHLLLIAAISSSNLLSWPNFSLFLIRPFNFFHFDPFSLKSGWKSNVLVVSYLYEPW